MCKDKPICDQRRNCYVYICTRKPVYRICGLTVLLSAFFIWRAESLTARLIIAAVGAAVLIFRWQISMMIYQFVASIFTLIALFIGIVLLCALPFVLIRLFQHF